jgi:hypothetical protein
MTLQKTRQMVNEVRASATPQARLALSQQALALLEKTPYTRESNKNAVQIAMELKEEVRKGYTDLDALKTANSIDAFIRRRLPGVEGLVLC